MDPYCWRGTLGSPGLDSRPKAIIETLFCRYHKVLADWLNRGSRHNIKNLHTESGETIYGPAPVQNHDALEKVGYQIDAMA